MNNRTLKSRKTLFNNNNNSTQKRGGAGGKGKKGANAAVCKKIHNILFDSNNAEKSVVKKSIITDDWTSYYNKNKKFKNPSTLPFNFFIIFFKKMLHQKSVRQFFVSKNKPGIPYYLIKLDFEDIHLKEKVNFIKYFIKCVNTDFIIDIAEQLESGGGHWTALKRENGVLEYMDSDPFYYGSSAEEKHATFHALVKTIPKPITIFGDKKKKRIQSPSFDTFCQSWSLLFLTLTNASSSNHYEKLLFYGKKVTEDINAEFIIFVNNLVFIIDFWIDLLESANAEFNQLLSSSLQWKLWNKDNILKKLRGLKEYIKSKKDTVNALQNIKEPLFEYVRDEVNKYMI